MLKAFFNPFTTTKYLQKQKTYGKIWIKKVVKTQKVEKHKN
jgi:hypothetical protein